MICDPLSLALFGGPIVRADAGHSRGNWQAKRASKQRQRSIAHQTGRQPNDKYKRYNVQGTSQTKKIGLRMMGEREDAAPMSRRSFLGNMAAGGARGLAGSVLGKGIQAGVTEYKEMNRSTIKHGFRPALRPNTGKISEAKGFRPSRNVEDHREPRYRPTWGQEQTDKLGGRLFGGRKYDSQRSDDFSDEHPLKSLRNHGWGHVGRGLHRNPAHRGHAIQFNTGVGKPPSYEHKNETGQRISGGSAKALGSHLKWFSGLHRGDGIGDVVRSAGKGVKRFAKKHRVGIARVGGTVAGLGAGTAALAASLPVVAAAPSLAGMVTGTAAGAAGFGTRNAIERRLSNLKTDSTRRDAISPPAQSRRKPDPMAQFSKGHARHQQKKKRFALLQKRIGHRQETVPAGLRG